MPNVYMKPYLILNQARRFLNTVYKMTWVYIVGSIKKLMGALTVFYYLRSHIDWPITHFLKKHWPIPNRSSPFDQLPQNRPQPSPHPATNYKQTWKLNCVHSTCDKIEVLLGTTWGTLWEHGKNTLGTRVNMPSPHQTLTYNRSLW
jgi:hypothetical protein